MPRAPAVDRPDSSGPSLPRRAGRLACALAALLAAACSGPPRAGNEPAIDALAQTLPDQAMVLLGEVHDNADGHGLRLQALARAVQAGWRPAIAMEQFDRENQPLLDRAMQTCPDADCVVRAASPGKSGWDWAHYRPVIELALRNGLPLVAANLSRTDASRIVREGLPAVFGATELRELGLDGDIDPELRTAQEREIAGSHCGKLPEFLHAPMATAQIARDAVMAGKVRRQAASRPVALLAGNGHVRRDLGVPRWLPDERVLVVGFTEQTAPEGRYDRDIVVAPVQRPDPCAAMRAAPAAR